MNIELCTTETLFETLKPEWNTLLQQSRGNRIFLTWEWQHTWWTIYHPGELRVLAIRNDTGELLGIAPWFIENNAQTGRTLRGIGCVDVTDYLELIVHQDHEEGVLSAIADWLLAHAALYDTIDLCNIPEASAILKYFPAILEARGLTVTIKPQEVCPIINLPTTFEDYINALDKKNRHELRRKIRRLEGEDGVADWYIVNANHNLEAELETFLSLMRASSPQKVEFLSNPDHLAFFRAIVPVMAAAGWLQLAFLRMNGTPAAAYLNFDYNSTISVYNSGIDMGLATSVSPGIVLLANLIEDAIKRAYHQFDFLRGNEDYKYRMGGKDTQIFMLIATIAEAIEMP